MPRILTFIIHGKTTGVDQRELGSSVLGSDFVSKIKTWSMPHTPLSITDR